MANYPDWVLKYKKKGTLVQKKRDDLYYLYRVHSRWNKDKKRAQLVTDEFLGKLSILFLTTLMNDHRLKMKSR
jgi:hypothetical protein